MYTPIYQYSCVVERVIDGDTFVGNIDLGFKIWMNKSIRLKDFDAPERNSKIEAERIHAQQALDFVSKILPPGSKVVLVTAKTAIYDRVEAAVYYIDPTTKAQLSLKDVLDMQGFAKRDSYV
jgi:endonuclease YncB( thermonuclease family)